MDAGGLDGRTIGGVDVGHDDRTTIIRFAFLFCYLSLLQNALFPHYFCYTPFRMLSKLNSLYQNNFIERDFEPM